MGIHFEPKRWQKIQETYENWWEGKLDRSIVKVAVHHAYSPTRSKPKAPLLSQENCNQLEYAPEELVDAMDYELEQMEFLGDAFPIVNFWAFGPSCLAGMCGARMENRTGNVWFQTDVQENLEKIHIQYDPESWLAVRMKKLYQAAQERWGNQVLLTMPDLGGIQDIVSVFRKPDQLMIDMYENPEEVIRLQQEALKAFFEAYRDLDGILKEKNPGYSNWGGLYSKTPFYILQDDFAYMISPSMFEEFALSDIERQAKWMGRSIYHLDGIGNLNHLDFLLDIPEIQVIQWVYGEGQPSAVHWMDVYEKIAQNGKNMEIVGSIDDYLKIEEKLSGKLFYHITVDDRKGTLQKNIEKKDCLNDYHVLPYERRKEAEVLLGEGRK